jgi:hypothetical protein
VEDSSVVKHLPAICDFDLQHHHPKKREGERKKRERQQEEEQEEEEKEKEEEERREEERRGQKERERLFPYKMSIKGTLKRNEECLLWTWKEY